MGSSKRKCREFKATDPDMNRQEEHSVENMSKLSVKLIASFKRSEENYSKLKTGSTANSKSTTIMKFWNSISQKGSSIGKASWSRGKSKLSKRRWRVFRK